MKKAGRLFLVVAALLALLAAFYCLRPGKSPRTAREDQPSQNVVPARVLPTEVATVDTPQRQPAVTNSPMVEFSSWTEKYLAASTAAEKQALIAQGEELAKARLAEM